MPGLEDFRRRVRMSTPKERRAGLVTANMAVRPARKVEFMPHEIEPLVEIPAGHVTLEGNLGIPADATGIVLFAHGSGSSRHSPRNRAVARMMRDARIATLL